MKYTEKNITYHELIGLSIAIVEHPDRTLIGRRGLVIDETSKTLVLEEGFRRIRVLKEHGVFEFTLPSGVKVLVRGIEILGRPEDRLKNIVRRRKWRT
ncbi:MAG: ribonuclease P protein subunit [Desulfurococcaceae archaeon]